MATSIFPAPKVQFLDANGDPLSGGKVYFYEPGTSTPKDTYSDYAGSIVNANPVVLDSRGEATIRLSGRYDVVVKTSADVTIYSYSDVLATPDSSEVTHTVSFSGAVERLVKDKLKDVTTVFDFMTATEIADVQARTEGEDVTAAIQSGIDAVATNGGVLFLPAGTYSISAALTIKSNVYIIGAGKGVSILKLISGSNDNMIVSNNFASADIEDFGLKNFSLDGQYFTTDWNDAAGAYGNTSGYGVKVRGYSFDIDLEIGNIAEVGLLSEALAGSAPANDQPIASINVEGEVFGKEAVIIRGPNDGYSEKIWVGNAGLLKRPQAETTTATSTEYSSDPVDGLVIDDGAWEFNFVHVYACWSGIGIRTRNSPRIEASHVVSESNRGQVNIDTNTVGAIGVLSIRNVGLLHPNWTGTIPTYTQPNALYDGVTLNGLNFMIGSLRAHRTITAITRVAGTTLLVVGGNNNHIGIATNNSTPTDASDADYGGVYTGDSIYITGDNNHITCTARDVKGNVISIDDGDNNIVDVIAEDQDEDSAGDAVLKRDASTSTTCVGNICRVTSHNSKNAFNSVGAPTHEEIHVCFKASSGDSYFTGTDRSYGSQRWHFSGQDITTPIHISTSAASEASYTIASGAITIKSYDTHVKIDTESAGATDDLDTINGGVESQIIILRSTSAARVPTIKDGTGNIQNAGDFALNSGYDSITLYYNGTDWVEISRSDNA